MSTVAAGQADRPGRRSAARLNAVQALYQIDHSTDEPEVVIDQFIAHRLGREIDGDRYRRPDAKLFANLVRGVSARRAEVDNVIAGALSNQRPIERLEVILRALMRAAVFELLATVDVPARVIINEYVDVAHAFFAGAEPGFVNGVLDRAARDLRPGELGESGGGQA